jgi:hypothetical protein
MNAFVTLCVARCNAACWSAMQAPGSLPHTSQHRVTWHIWAACTACTRGTFYSLHTMCQMHTSLRKWWWQHAPQQPHCLAGRLYMLLSCTMAAEPAATASLAATRAKALQSAYVNVRQSRCQTSSLAQSQAHAQRDDPVAALATHPVRGTQHIMQCMPVVTSYWRAMASAQGHQAHQHTLHTHSTQLCCST